MYSNSLKIKMLLSQEAIKVLAKLLLKNLQRMELMFLLVLGQLLMTLKNLLKILKKHSVKIEIIKLDLADKSSISKCIEDIYKIEKNIDVLINNAGMLFNSLFLMTPEKKLQEMFQINYFSQVNFTQIIAKGMIKNKSGSIIFVSSTSGINGDFGRFAYSSSKAAVISTVKTLSKELSSYKIRVNAVSPGLTETDLMISNTKKEIIENETKKISLKRIANTNEIADVITFLASDKSSYINGQNIIIDGGYL